MPRSIRRPDQRHDRADRRLAQSLCLARGSSRHPRAVPRDRAERSERAAGAGLRPVRALHRGRLRMSISRTACRRCARPGSPRAAMRRPRAARSSPEDNGNVSADRLAPPCPATRALRVGRPGQLVTQYRIRPRRHHHRRDDLCRASREPRARGGARGRGRAARRRRELRRRDPRVRHAGIRARRDRARPGDHPRQHQPRRTRADDDRPQLPGQGQRQHRQFRA